MSDYSSNVGSGLGLGDSAGGGSRIITAMFDSMEDALEAVDRLRNAGLPEGSVRMTGARETEQTSEDTTGESKGFFEMLGDMFFPSDDREVYAEGLSRGGYLVTASDVPASLYDMAVDILDDEGAVDIDERSESWRSEGWAGTGSVSATSDQYQSDAEFGTIGSGSIAGGAGSGIIGGGETPDLDRSQTSDYEGGSAAGSDADRSGMAGRSTEGGLFSGASHDDEGVLPVVEERLRVGKRDTSHGRVRVRSYVVEEPVSETVTLAEERVDIERRPVDRAVAAGDDAFQQRTIEAEEFREEAVISKEARVVEEVELRKTRDSHEQTIEDTVRRTEVEVEHEDDHHR